MPLIPNLTYNEERPQFVGRDVEGIKELNQVLAQKYDINKQATIQTGDLLNSFKTLDKDSGYLTDAITGFENDLQFITDNNQFERAGQVIEKAVTNIKRNKALEQSVANYANYNTYVNELKENPKGWTDEEVSNIVSFSLDQYGGVKIDKNGQAVGSFYGYNPGEKINVLSEYDTALKGFASDKGFEMSEIYNMLEDGTRKGFSTTTKETITRDEILAYLKQYTNNDPRINKYYETKSIIDSKKHGMQLANEVYNNINRLDLFSIYGSKYKRFLKDNNIDADNSQVDGIKFMEWMLEKEEGTKYDIKGLVELANSNDPSSKEAKFKLAEINNKINKQLDSEAAAIKNGFTKQEIKFTHFADKLTEYKLKKLADDTNYLYDMVGSSVEYQNKYKDKNGFKLLEQDISNLDAKLEVKDEEISNNLSKAIAARVYDPNKNVWLNPNSSYKIINDKLQTEKNIYSNELNRKDKYYQDAVDYANNKLNSNTSLSPEKIIENQEKLASSMQNRLDEINIELRQLSQVFDSKSLTGKILLSFDDLAKANILEKKKSSLENELSKLNSLGIQRYSNELNEELTNSIASTINNPYFNSLISKTKERGTAYEKAKQEYLDNNSISTMNPTILQIDPESNKNVVRAMDVTEGHYSRNNAAYVARDQNGEILSDPRDRPENIDITGMSVGRFSDGMFYYEAVGQVYDDNKKLVNAVDRKGNLKKYYISAPNNSINQHVGNMLINNQNPTAVAMGYQLSQPLGFRYDTENISMANSFLPIYNNKGDKMGEVKIASSETGGIPDFNTTLVEWKIPTTIRNSYKEKTNIELPESATFSSRYEFEFQLNEINDIVNSK